MASEIRVNKINSRTGVGTITLSPTGVDFTGIATVATLKASNIELADNSKIKFGTGDDLEIYHDGSTSFIKDVGTGVLAITSNGGHIALLNGDQTENLAKFIVDGATELYHNGAKKFETTSAGTKNTGVIDCTGSILLTDQSGNDIGKLRFGDGQDLEIYHDGSESYIADEGTGGITISGGLLSFKNQARDETHATMTVNGSVDLYYDNNKKFETKSDGVDITGELQCDSLDVDGAADITGILNLGNNLDMPDNAKIILGTGDDLQIYHDSNNSFIKDAGTGRLSIVTSQLQVTNAADSEVMIKATQDDAVELYYDSVLKLKTQTNGIMIGASNATYNEVANQSASAKLHISGGGSGSGNIEIFGASHSSNSKEIHMTTNSVQRIKLNQVGGMTLRADTYGFAVRSIASASSSNTVFYGAHSSGGIELGTGAIEIYTNGNVKNTNNSYGSLSDQRLKENIVDATSQWSDIKSLQIRKYNFREATGHQTHTQLGLIAQEVESVSPGLVETTGVREGETVLDADGNQLESIKSVNYSVLYMKAVKALQEAQTRIETLETQNTAQQTQINDLITRVTALEG